MKLSVFLAIIILLGIVAGDARAQEQGADVDAASRPESSAHARYDSSRGRIACAERKDSRPESGSSAGGQNAARRSKEGRGKTCGSSRTITRYARSTSARSHVGRYGGRASARSRERRHERQSRL